MENGMTIKTVLFDYGRTIGVAVEYNGNSRVAGKLGNPFWPEVMNVQESFNDEAASNG